MSRKEKPGAFMASVLIHLMVLFVAARFAGRARPVAEPEPEDQAPPVTIARMRLPPREALRPVPPPPRPAPATPRERPEPRPDAKDRMSIGGPSELRQKTPLQLRRDEDLTRTIARGRPDAPPTVMSPAPTAPPRTAPPQPPAAADPRVASRDPGAMAAPETPPRITGLADAPLAPSPRPVGSPRPAGGIAESLRTLDERLAAASARGLSTGTVQQMGTSPLMFDPQGADFTAWINHFKNEVYRNWIVPPSVSMGARGQVSIEFVVERSGAMSGLRILQSSGTPALDRAARNALLGSRFLALPSDFRPDQVLMQVTFFYNERGARS